MRMWYAVHRFLNKFFRRQAQDWPLADTHSNDYKKHDPAHKSRKAQCYKMGEST